jgi:tol-pal system protein YbgF
MRRRASFGCFLLATLSLGAGCLSAETSERRQLESLSKGIELDRFAVDKSTPRVSENDETDAGGRATASSPSSRTSAEVGSASPPGPPNGTANGVAIEDPADTSPRTVIRIWGSGKGQSNVAVTEIAPRAAAKDVAAPSSVGDAGAKRAYDLALALVNAHAYQQAAGALGTFLLQWPDDANAANAIYWQAECYYSMGEYSRASELLDEAIERYPKSTRIPDCLLRLGLSHQKLGDEAKARGYFQRLAKEFPGSEAAHRIPTGGASGG